MSPCIFCERSQERGTEDRFGAVVAFPDHFPVTPLHWLVVPFRHRPDFFALTADEKSDVNAALVALRPRALAADPTVTGFNIGWNCGASAGQTVMHAHCHLIPRRDGDVEAPRGGVRGVIPAMRDYKAEDTA